MRYWIVASFIAIAAMGTFAGWHQKTKMVQAATFKEPQETQEDTAIIPEELRGNWYAEKVDRPLPDGAYSFPNPRGGDLRYQVTMRGFTKVSTVNQNEYGNRISPIQEFRSEGQGQSFSVIRRGSKLVRFIRRIHWNGSKTTVREYDYSEPNLVSEWNCNEKGDRIGTRPMKYVLR